MPRGKKSTRLNGGKKSQCMDSLFTLLLIFSLLPFLGCTETPGRTCGSGDYFTFKMKTDPVFRLNHARIEQIIGEYYKSIGEGAGALRGGRVIIPVVVHVLHNGASDATNVSDTQIESQINVLNRDFRMTNPDISAVPDAFLTVVADSRIEFQLARRDPACNATNGITRQRAGRSFYTSSTNDAKSSSSGGVDPWDTTKYLNIWVVPDLRDSGGVGILGYSSFPADEARVQGFVVEYNYFGDTGTGASDSRFNMGRTAVHEFGHFFNLFHIWGDDHDRRAACNAAVECLGSDQVDDTPNAGAMNYGVPTFPLTDCCSTTSPGVMFMNYMDYVDDRAMVMFSMGQVDRMIATLYGTLPSLIGSDAILPPPDEGSPADLYVGDTPEDIGDEPNDASDRYYISEDIWLRNTSDGESNQEHENPVYVSGRPVYVYVRVRNKGCAPSMNDTVRLYWAKASTGLSWPDPWNGGVTVEGAPMGGEIGMEFTGIIPGGGYAVLEYVWDSLPDPDDYASFGADNVHFCLLARIETSSGMTFTETADLGANVRQNNNIAWKNISIASGSGSAREAHVMAGNYSFNEMVFSFSFEAVEKEASVFEFGNVFVELPSELFNRWLKNGGSGNDIEIMGNTMIRIIKAGATIDRIVINPGEAFAVNLTFEETNKTLGPRVYFLDMVQYNGMKSPATIVGGQRFLLKAWNK